MFRNGGAGDPMPAGTAFGIGLFLIATGVILVFVGMRAGAGRLCKNHFVGAFIVLTGLAWMVGWVLAAGSVGQRAAEAALSEGDSGG